MNNNFLSLIEITSDNILPHIKKINYWMIDHPGIIVFFIPFVLFTISIFLLYSYLVPKGLGFLANEVLAQLNIYFLFLFFGLMVVSGIFIIVIPNVICRLIYCIFELKLVENRFHWFQVWLITVILSLPVFILFISFFIKRDIGWFVSFILPIMIAIGVLAFFKGSGNFFGEMILNSLLAFVVAFLFLGVIIIILSFFLKITEIFFKSKEIYVCILFLFIANGILPTALLDTTLLRKNASQLFMLVSSLAKYLLYFILILAVAAQFNLIKYGQLGEYTLPIYVDGYLAKHRNIIEDIKYNKENNQIYPWVVLQTDKTLVISRDKNSKKLYVFNKNPFELKNII